MSVISDEYETLREGAGVIDLGCLAVIRMTGDDRVRFLQGMVTADVARLVPGGGCYAFQLDQKGHILADLHLLSRTDDLLIVCGAANREAVMSSLDRFIIADRVELEADDGWLIGVEGPGAPEVLATATGAEPPADRSWDHAELADGTQAIGCTWSGQPAAWLMGHGEAARDAATARLTEAGARSVGMDAVELVRIENGIFRHGHDFNEKTLVQETDLLHGVSFDKGCYRGQETVERVRSRGAVNRMLTGLRVAGDPPEPETPIEKDGEKRPVGHVTSATASPRFDGALALGYVRVKHRAPDTALKIGDADATVASLPFEDER